MEKNHWHVEGQFSIKAYNKLSEIYYGFETSKSSGFDVQQNKRNFLSIKLPSYLTV